MFRKDNNSAAGQLSFSSHTPVVNTENCKSEEHLLDYLKACNEVDHHFRKDCRKKTRYSTIKAYMIGKEIYEPDDLNNDTFLETLEYQNYYVPPPARNRSTDQELLQSLDNIMSYFNEEIPITPKKKTYKPLKLKLQNRIAATIAILQRKASNLAENHSGGQKTPQAERKEESKKLTFNETVRSQSSWEFKLEANSRVKHIAKIFNNKIVQKEHKVAKPKSSKSVNKMQTFLTTLRTSEHSPVMKRKTAQNVSNNSYLEEETIFCKLPVKDKVLLYQKFIDHVSKNQSKLLEGNSKNGLNVNHRGYVKRMCETLETFCRPNKSIISQTMPRFKKTPNVFLSATAQKLHEAEDALIPCIRNMPFKENPELPVSTLRVVLKPCPALKKKNYPYDKTKKFDCSTSLNLPNETAKRNHSAVRNTLSTNLFAPPKKIRRLHQECFALTQFLRNSQFQQIFYSWLKKKNGKLFDIVPINKPMLREAIEENSTLDGLSVISNTLNKKHSKDEFVVEVELPLSEEESSQMSESKENHENIRDGFEKSTKEKSQPNALRKKELNEAAKLCIRKKKLRRCISNVITWRKNNDVANRQSTDSADSDLNTGLTCGTLPRIKNLFTRKLPLRHRNYSSAKARPAITAIDLNISELNKSWLNRLNSPTKVNELYTLTAMSTPSNNTASDVMSSADLLEQSKKTTITKSPKLARKLIDSFIDQGFETGSNGTESRKSNSPTINGGEMLIVTDFDKKYKTINKIAHQGGLSSSSTPSKLPKVSMTNTSFVENLEPNTGKFTSGPHIEKPDIVKSSDIGYIGLDSLEAETLDQQNDCASLDSVELINPNNSLNSECKFSTIPMENIETNEWNELELKEHLQNCFPLPDNTCNFATHQYQRELLNIFIAIDKMGKDGAFEFCSDEQLKSFMFFLNQYAMHCWATCREHIKTISHVVAMRSDHDN
uniref:Uncharacterized protein n=1 Tax=Glossina austeni TaxID=7395 RepID=A0A1A9V7G2_GLOAU